MFSPVIFVIGWFVGFLGIAMFIPAAVDWTAGNADWQVFVTIGITCVFVGVSLTIATRGPEFELDRRQGFLLTAGSWITIALFSALPFAFASVGLSFSDSFFEAMSGITTTGSTVMTGLDQVPRGTLLWRGMLQWIGGIGIIVMGVAMFPFLKVGGMQLFRMESSDVSEKPVAQAKTFVLLLVTVYAGLTFASALALNFAGMSPFEAVVHAMTAISTGGFSTSDGSIAHFRSATIDWIVIVIMLMGSIPFVLYVGVLRRRWTSLVRAQQVRSFLKLLAAVTAVMTAWLWAVDRVPFFDALTMATFNITSIVTTTGFTSTDYSQWGTLPIGLFFLLTFVGACTGSTCGGIKIFRFEVMWSAFRSYIWHRLYPSGCRPATYEGRPISDDVTVGVLMFAALYLLTTALISVALEAMGVDLVTAITGAATAVSNVGPGLGNIIGPAGNFASLPDGAKWILAFAMLLGRLELFTVLVLFLPTFWTD